MAAMRKARGKKLQRAEGRSVRFAHRMRRGDGETATGRDRALIRQMEFWDRVERAASDNPDLPMSLVVELLLARAEPREEMAPFVPRGKAP